MEHYIIIDKINFKIVVFYEGRDSQSYSYSESSLISIANNASPNDTFIFVPITKSKYDNEQVIGLIHEIYGESVSIENSWEKRTIQSLGISQGKGVIRIYPEPSEMYEIEIDDRKNKTFSNLLFDYRKDKTFRFMIIISDFSINSRSINETFFTKISPSCLYKNIYSTIKTERMITAKQGTLIFKSQDNEHPNNQTNELFLSKIEELKRAILNNNNNIPSSITPLGIHLSEVHTIINQILQEITKIERHISEQDKKIDYLVDESSNTNQPSDNYVNDLKEELSKYKEDYYYKSMRKQGIDSIIDISVFLYENKQAITGNGSEETCNMIDRLIKYVTDQLRRLGVKTVQSKEETIFNSQYMVTYEKDIIETNNKKLKGKVAKSIIPAYFWRLPLVNGQGNHPDGFLMKEEVVIIYK